MPVIGTKKTVQIDLKGCVVPIYSSSSKKLMFVFVASAMAGIHGDCQILASMAPHPEIENLVPQGQICFR